MQKQAVVTVDGRAYKISYLQTSESIRIYSKISKFVLPAAGRLFGRAVGGLAAAKSALDQELDIDGALAFLGANLNEDEALDVVQKLLSCVLMGDGSAILFDSYWMGDTVHMFKVVQAVLEHNYADFFAVLAGLGQKLLKRIEGSSTTPASAPSSPTSGG